jgi:hypothetical protein
LEFDPLSHWISSEVRQKPPLMAGTPIRTAPRGNSAFAADNDRSLFFVALFPLSPTKVASTAPSHVSSPSSLLLPASITDLSRLLLKIHSEPKRSL